MCLTISNYGLCLATFLLFFQINSIFSQCASGWTFYANSKGGHCYSIFSGNGMSYYQARDACSIMRGYLATIEDQSEFNFLTQTLLNTNVTKNYVAVWVLIKLLI